MNNTRQITYLFLLLIVLGFSGWGFLESQQKEPMTQSVEDHNPDAFVTQAVVIRFDADGSLESKMQADKITHYLKNDMSYIDKPDILLYKKDQSPWQIKSTYGIAENGTEKITFSKNVYLHQDKDKQNKFSTIKTERLDYYPKKEYAETDLKITMMQPSAILTSVGMQAYLKEKRVNLLSKAEGQYEERG